MRLPSAHSGPSEQVRAWTTAFDAFAAAGGAVAAATAVHDLLAGTRPSRSVAARDHDPELATSLARLPLAGCPVIVAAMHQRTPLVQASMTDSAELGILPDGRRVADVLGAGSYAVSPITIGNAPVGAITVVRGRMQRPVTFLELNVLARIADLAAAAIERLDGRERAHGT